MVTDLQVCQSKTGLLRIDPNHHPSCHWPHSFHEQAESLFHGRVHYAPNHNHPLARAQSERRGETDLRVRSAGLGSKNLQATGQITTIAISHHSNPRSFSKRREDVSSAKMSHSGGEVSSIGSRIIAGWSRAARVRAEFSRDSTRGRSAAVPTRENFETAIPSDRLMKCLRTSCPARMQPQNPLGSPQTEQNR